MRTKGQSTKNRQVGSRGQQAHRMRWSATLGGMDPKWGAGKLQGVMPPVPQAGRQDFGMLQLALVGVVTGGGCRQCVSSASAVPLNRND